MDKARKSQLAEQIINNPLWEESFEDMRKDLFEDFCTVAGDYDTRERISLAMDMLNDLQNQIEAKFVEGMPLKIVGDNNG